MKEEMKMPDYKAMYIKLFQTQTKVIRMLQAAQRITEEMYIGTCEPGEDEPFTVTGCEDSGKEDE